MAFKNELQSLDSVCMNNIVDSMIDKGNELGGVGQQIEELWQQYPALQVLHDKLMDYFDGNTVINEARRARMASAAVLLALREYAEVDEMRQRFPDAPETPRGDV